MSILKEFKTFAMKGNVMDLAVGVVIGTAFGKIVSSLVNDIIMPPIGLFIGRVDFTNLFINLSSVSYDTLAEAQQAGAPTINYGLFINNIVHFLIIAFSVFLVIKQMNKFKQKEEPAKPSKKDCPYCLSSVPIQATKCAFCTSDLA